MNRTVTVSAKLGETDTANHHNCTNRIAIYSKISKLLRAHSTAQSMRHSQMHVQSMLAQLSYQPKLMAALKTQHIHQGIESGLLVSQHSAAATAWHGTKQNSVYEANLFSTMLRGIWVMGAARMGMRRSTMGAAKGCSCSGLHWIASSPASHIQYCC